MDPQKCWEELCQAFDDRRREDAEASIVNLVHWLDRGGTAPQVTPISNPETLAWMTRVLCQQFQAIMRDWE